MRFLQRFNWIGLATVMGLIALWQVLVSTKIVEFSTIPAPSQVLHSMGELLGDGALTQPVVHTTLVILGASALAILIGTILGSLVGLSSAAFNWSMASVDFLRNIPVVALLPVAVLAWGPSIQSEVIITVWAATWIMLVNTAGAFSSVHPRLMDVSATLGLSARTRLHKIWLPAITPSLLVGARLAIVAASLTALIAETLVNPEGIGWELVRAQQSLDPGRLWVFALIAGWFGYLLNLLLIHAVRLAAPGGRDNPALQNS